MNKLDKEFLARQILGMCGKMISVSKSGYIQRNPRNLTIFNANICTRKEKIWFGDLDVTLSKNSLIQLAQKLNENVYVLYEMDGIFDNEETPLISRHVVCFTTAGELLLGHHYSFLKEDDRYDL